jgi:hypothetical protein
MRIGRIILTGVVAGGVAVYGGTQAFDDDTTRDDAGVITEGGGLGAFVIQVGDCVQVPEEELVQSVEAVPCDTPHDAEAYAVFDLPEVEDFDLEATYLRADEGCVERWDDAIGTDYATDPDLDLYVLGPTDLSWKGGDREVVCFVVRLDGERSSGSVRVDR